MFRSKNTHLRRINRLCLKVRILCKALNIERNLERLHRQKCLQINWKILPSGQVQFGAGKAFVPTPLFPWQTEHPALEPH